MFTKTTFALAFALATASGALAATKQQSFPLHHDAYDARGSAAHPGTSRLAPGVAVEGRQIRLDDCMHVAFPQCDGNATQTQGNRP